MDKTQNKYWVLLIYVILALATFIAYEQVRRNDFVNYDDDDYVTQNPQVKAGITRESVVWAFTTSHAANWHPLTWLSHMLDCQLFGLNPLWHHLTNLFLHITNTLLLFGVLKRMTGTLWRSAFVAAAFALHPLHVESVAWVAERKDVLSGLFWMLTMWLYIRYAQRPGFATYLLIMLTFALGLMAKQMLVTLPFVLLLLDYWPLGRLQLGQQSGGKALPHSKSVKVSYQSSTVFHLIGEKIPLFILAVVSGVVTYIVQQSAGAIMKQGEAFPLNIRIANALVSYLGYIVKMIYPSRLAPLYPHPGYSLPMWQAIVSALILAIVSVSIIFTARRRYLAAGWLWYLGTLAPVIGLIQVGAQAMADRYTYLPLIGIFIMVAWGVAEPVAKWRYRRIGLGISAGLVLAVLLICTRIQVRHWQNNLTLFGHALAVTENNHIMHNNYGNALREKGRMDEAATQFKEALRINPEYLTARDNISQVFLALGRIEEAIAGFTEVLRLKPDYPNAVNNLGVALQKQGKINEAVEKWKKALELKPDHPDAHYNMGLVLAEQGKYDEAIKHFNEALQAKPDWPGPHNDLGLAYAQLGKLDLAIQNYNEALRLKPDYFKAHYNLGFALFRQDKLDDAIRCWSETVRLDPSNHKAYHNLGIAFYRQGNIEQAIKHWAEAVRLKPDWAEALNNLAWALATVEDEELRNPAEAVRLAERACELTDYEQAGMLDTLGVAYAAAGRFPKAIETAKKATKLAEATGKKNLAQGIQNRLQLYKARRPYREK